MVRDRATARGPVSPSFVAWGGYAAFGRVCRYSITVVFLFSLITLAGCR